MANGEFEMYFRMFRQSVKGIEDNYVMSYNDNYDLIREAIDKGYFDLTFDSINESLDRCVPVLAEMNKTQLKERDLEGWFLRFVNISYDPRKGWSMIEDRDFYRRYMLNVERLGTIVSTVYYLKEPKTKSGRPVDEFKDCIADRYKKDTTRIIENIESVIKGRTGKSAARVIAAAINRGYIDQTKLTCAMIYNAFGNVIIKNSFKEYLIEVNEKRRREIFDCQETKEIETRIGL